jgi:hypothetical protein
MADYIVPPVSDLRLINAAEKIAAAMPGGGKVDITSSTGKAVTKELIVKLTDTDSFAPFLIQQIQVGWSKKNQHNQNGNFVVLYTRNASVKFSSADPSLDYVTVEVRGQDVFEAEEVLPISKIALEAYGVGIASQPPIGGTSIDAVTTIHATILDN